MLNMLLAIIMDTYAEVKGALSQKQTIYWQAYIMFQRWSEIKRGKALPLQYVKHSLQKANSSPPKLQSGSKAVDTDLEEEETVAFADDDNWEEEEILTVETFQSLVPGLGL